MNYFDGAYSRRKISMLVGPSYKLKMFKTLPLWNSTYYSHLIYHISILHLCFYIYIIFLSHLFQISSNFFSNYHSRYHVLSIYIYIHWRYFFTLFPLNFGLQILRRIFQFYINHNMSRKPLKSSLPISHRNVLLFCACPFFELRSRYVSFSNMIDFNFIFTCRSQIARYRHRCFSRCLARNYLSPGRERYTLSADNILLIIKHIAAVHIR